MNKHEVRTINKALGNKHQCPDCNESYHYHGMLVAHKEFVHVGKPNTYQKTSVKKVEDAVEDSFKKDYLEQEFDFQADSTDLDEARVALGQ